MCPEAVNQGKPALCDPMMISIDSGCDDAQFITVVKEQCFVSKALSWLTRGLPQAWPRDFYLGQAGSPRYDQFAH